MPNFRKTIAGYRKSVVNAYLIKMKRLQLSEMTDMELEITSLKMKRDRLHQQLEVVHDEQASAVDIIPIEEDQKVEHSQKEEASGQLLPFDKKLKVDQGSVFWEGVDEYMEDDISEEHPNLQLDDAIITNQAVGGDTVVDMPAFFRSSYAPSQQATVQPKQIKEPIMPSNDMAISLVKDQTKSSMHREEITEKVNLLRRKYIVGKIAGEDLYSDNGQFIVAKNERITDTVMEEADRQGKLVQLIVHMMIPGLEDES